MPFIVDGKEVVYTTDLNYKVDRDDFKTMGWKQNQYELQGVPVRIAIGPRDIGKEKVVVSLRDQEEKQEINLENFGADISQKLFEMQERLYSKTIDMRIANTVKVNTRDDFTKALDDGKFVLAHRDGTMETEENIKTQTKATIRCIPYDDDGNDLYSESGVCILTGKPSTKRVLFAIAY